MPLVTVPAMLAKGMTVAEAAAAAAAAAKATTAATAATTVAAAAPTITAATPTVASALPSVVAGSGAPTTAAFTGQLVTPAATSAVGGTGGAGITAGGAGGAGGAGVTTAVPGADAVAANAGQGVMTNAPANIAPNAPFAANPTGDPNIASAISNTTASAPTSNTVANAPFAQNPTGDPNVARAISNQATGMPGNPIDPNANLIKGVDYVEMPGVDVPHADAVTGNALERGITSAVKFAKDNPYTMAAASMGVSYLTRPEPPEKKTYARRDMSGFQRSEPSTGEYTPIYQPASYAAEGGLMSYAVGGPVEQMAAMNAVGANTGYPQAGLQTPTYSNPTMQRPQAANVIAPSADAGVNTYTGEARFAEGGNVPAVEKLEARNRKMLGIKTPQEVEEDFERGQDVMRREGFGIVTDSDVDTRRKSPAAAAITQLKKIGKRVGAPVSDMPKSDIVDTDVFHAARGGITYGLGSYSDGGRLLRGPGDGVSDSIPASIGGRQPARLADGEFVVPARIVSELGNGSTEAGARKLYAMMERVQKGRRKSVGKGKVAVNSKADKHLPA